MSRLDFSNTIEKMIRFDFFTRIPTSNITIVDTYGNTLYKFRNISASTRVRYGTRYTYTNIEHENSGIYDNDMIEFICGFNIKRISVKDSICRKSLSGSKVLYGLDYIIEVDNS